MSVPIGGLVLYEVGEQLGKRCMRIRTESRNEKWERFVLQPCNRATMQPCNHSTIFCWSFTGNLSAESANLGVGKQF
jgi:hypothetical protein